MARKKQSDKNTIRYAFVVIDFWARNSNFKDKQVVPRVGRPTVMLTISKQTVMKEECYYEV